MTAVEPKTATERIRARVVLDLIRSGEIVVYPRCAHCSARSLRREAAVVANRSGTEFRCLSCSRITKVEDARRIRQAEMKTMMEGRNLNRAQSQAVERRVQRVLRSGA